MLAVPFAIRIADAKHGGEPGPPSYLPALEGPRSRQPFNPDLFLLALLYSLPLWIHSVWKEAVPGSSPFATAQACSLRAPRSLREIGPATSPSPEPSPILPALWH